MANGILQKATQAVTVIGLVAVPAFGGQFVSAAAKAKVTKLRNAAAGSRAVEFFVDLGGGVLAQALPLGLAAAIGMKGSVLRALPFTLAGVVMGALLPIVDTGIDKWVRALIGGTDDAAGADAADASTTPGGPRRMHGTRRSSTLRALPGGKRDTVYQRSKSMRVPGGGVTVEANQAEPVALSRRLRVPPRQHR